MCLSENMKYTSFINIVRNKVHFRFLNHKHSGRKRRKFKKKNNAKFIPYILCAPSRKSYAALLFIGICFQNVHHLILKFISETYEILWGAHRVMVPSLAMSRWRCYDVTMAIARCHDGVVTMPWWRCSHRAIAITIVTSPSYY